MKIVDKLVEIIAPHTIRGSAIEYGSAPEALHGNSLFDYEVNNWKVICLQPDKNCFEELRIFRRFARHLNCDGGGCPTIDQAISMINLEDIQILLIKNTPDPLPVIQGFSLERRNTQIVCVQQNENYPSRAELTIYLKSRGYNFLERVLVSDIYVRSKDHRNGLHFSESIFEV
jgi:hypothetical protein